QWRIEQAWRVAAGDRLRKRVDLLIAYLLVDVRGEQARRELGVLWFVDDEPGGGLNRELVEFARARAVVEAADRLRGDAQGIHVGEAGATPIHGAHDLVDVDGFARAVAFADLHRRVRRARVMFRGRAARAGGCGVSASEGTLAQHG